jgi:hypothetical protein
MAIGLLSSSREVRILIATTLVPIAQVAHDEGTGSDQGQSTISSWFGIGDDELTQIAYVGNAR